MRNGEDWTEQTRAQAEEAIGYAFRDGELLKACFTHSTFSNVFGGRDNERLEFLGDSVVQLYITEKLYKESGADEGKLTDKRQKFVSQKALESAERRAGLMRFLRRSGGESNLGGKTPSNLFEAVVAGIYLDGGMAPAARFLERYLTEAETENYKSILQEYVQERAKQPPEYRTEEKGGEHICTVRALGVSASGAGSRNKEAEMRAAQALYEILKEREQH